MLAESQKSSRCLDKYTIQTFPYSSVTDCEYDVLITYEQMGREMLRYAGISETLLKPKKFLLPSFQTTTTCNIISTSILVTPVATFTNPLHTTASAQTFFCVTIPLTSGYVFSHHSGCFVR
jgi:hypothetical protein